MLECGTRLVMIEVGKKMPKSNRTILQFASQPDFWKIVDVWAIETHVKLIETKNGYSKYKKGSMLTCPIYIELSDGGGNVRIEAYLKPVTIPWSIWRLIFPDTLELKSGGVGMIPRAVGRKALNILLQRLGQPIVK